MMNTTNGYLGACLTYSQDLDNEEQRAREPDRRDAGAKLFLACSIAGQTQKMAFPSSPVIEQSE